MSSADYEKLVPLIELAKCLRQSQRPNKHLDIKILFRWVLKGISGNRLQTTRIQGQVCSTTRWLAEFLQKTGAYRRHRLSPALCECLGQTLRRARGVPRPTDGPLPAAPFARHETSARIQEPTPERAAAGSR